MASVYGGRVPQIPQYLRDGMADVLEGFGAPRDASRIFVGAEDAPPIPDMTSVAQTPYPPTMSPLGRALSEATPPQMPAMMASAPGLVPLMSMLSNQRQQGGVPSMPQMTAGIGNLTSGYGWNGIPRAAAMDQFSNQAAANTAAGAPGL
jgi:hypothetical protein